MEINPAYIRRSKQQVLKVWQAVLAGGLAGRSFTELAKELALSEGSLLKELHNLAATGLVERRSTGCYGVSPQFMEAYNQALFWGIRIEYRKQR